MKRSKFILYIQGAPVANAFSWNGALKKAADLVRVSAGKEKQIFLLTESNSVKNEDGFYRGFRIWEGMKTKEKITVFIERETECT